MQKANIVTNSKFVRIETVRAILNSISQLFDQILLHMIKERLSLTQEQNLHLIFSLDTTHRVLETQSRQ